MAGSEETLVIVDLLEDGAGTLVKLTHSGFWSEEIRGRHAQGWECWRFSSGASSRSRAASGRRDAVGVKHCVEVAEGG